MTDPSGCLLAFLCALLFWVSFTSQAMAACSTDYLGRATINEVAGKTKNDPTFIEVKLLDTTITAAIYDAWTLSFCTGSGLCGGPIALSSGDDSSLPYITIGMPLIPNYLYIDLSGMNILLRDAAGNTIDYLSVNGVTSLRDASCTPAFPWQHPGDVSTKDILRIPDGTGNWSNWPGGSADDTGGDTNDQPLPDGTTPPRLDISSGSAAKGSPVTFTITLLDPVGAYPATVNYRTMDGTAIASTDYALASGTITFPASTPAGTTATVSVHTNLASAGGLFFWLFLDLPVNASIVNHYGLGEILASPSPAIDHFEIIHDGAALTCTPETITLRACETPDCSVLSSGDITVTLSVSGGANFVGGSTRSFSTGSISLELRDTTAETVTLGVATSTPGAASPTQCTSGVGGSCVLTFSDSGFAFTIPTQVACQPSGAITISAVRKDDITQACVPAFANRTEHIGFWSTYLNPVTPPVPATVSVNGAAIGKSQAAATPILLSFDSQGKSSITVLYSEAGKLQLDALFAGSGAEAGLTLHGAASFVARPAGLCVYSDDAGADCASGDATCTTFVKAGSPFNLKVRGVCFEAAGEADTDFCTGNGTTRNFQLANIALGQNLVAPSGGVAGSLAITSFSMTAGDAGSHTITNQAISEVGVFTITATPPDYIDPGVAIPASTSANLGRFYPDRFTTSIANGAFTDSCTGFTYSGQPFSYGTVPAITITPQNISGVDTLNYRDAFRKLTVADVLLNYPTSDAITLGADLATPLAISVTPQPASLSPTSPLTLTLGPDVFTYTRTLPWETDNSLVAPFVARLSLALVAVTDSDGVAASDLATAKSFMPAGIEIRYGRAVAINGHGPETAPISLDLLSEYYDGANWSPNIADSCSLAPYVKTENGTIAVSETPSSPLSLTAGRASLTLVPVSDPAPAGGTVQIDYNVDAWLEDDPLAIATFGLYRGNDRIINWQEIMR